MHAHTYTHMYTGCTGRCSSTSTAFVGTHIYDCVLKYIHTYIHKCIYIHIHIQALQDDAAQLVQQLSAPEINAKLKVKLFTSTHQVYIHTYVRMYVDTYIRTPEINAKLKVKLFTSTHQVYIHTYVRIYVDTYIRTPEINANLKVNLFTSTH